VFGSKGPKIDIEIRLSEILLEIKEMVGLASVAAVLTGANFSDGEPTIEITQTIASSSLKSRRRFR